MPNKIINTDKLGRFKNKMEYQKSTMPTASLDWVGKIIQYTGATDSTYTNGYFYKCDYDGRPSAFKWSQVNIQPKGTVVVNFTVTLSASQWSSTVPYTLVIGWSSGFHDIYSTDTPILDVVVSDTVSTGLDEIEQWSNISKVTCGNNSLTFSCYENKPTVDLTVAVKVVR